MYSRIYRDKKNKKLGGVCAGFANYFDIDPTFIRLAFIALAILGPGVLVYIIAWIIIPESIY